jgi:hypothetical protein
MVLADDLTGNGKMDLLVTTMNGNVCDGFRVWGQGFRFRVKVEGLGLTLRV